MLSADIVTSRIITAERYLEIVDGELPGEWSDLREYAVARKDLPIALALVHPQCWEEIATSTQVLGQRAFHIAPLLGTRFCGAADYWGVPCRTRDDPTAEVVADHAWPYSLGGPTIAANIRWLCRRHNAAKSSDVHLYPWEGLWPTWLNDVLNRIEYLHRVARLTS